MNAWARANAASIPDSLERVLPITGEDVLAHGLRVLQGTFVTGQRVVAQRRAWERRREAAGPGAGDRPASNAWAVAPSRSASGGAMLLANPHLPWGDLFTWFEAQLVAPGMDVYGATLVGMPVVAIGFNDRLGWTHTVNTHDGADLYELTLDRGGYLCNGEARAFETRTDTLVVRRPDGS